MDERFDTAIFPNNILKKIFFEFSMETKNCKVSIKDVLREQKKKFSTKYICRIKYNVAYIKKLGTPNRQKDILIMNSP